MYGMSRDTQEFIALELVSGGDGALIEVEGPRAREDLEQMTEAVHVATAIRGGASLVHGIQMLDQVKKLVM